MPYKTGLVLGFLGESVLTSPQKNGIRYWLGFFKPSWVVHRMMASDGFMDVVAESMGIKRQGQPCFESANEYFVVGGLGDVPLSIKGEQLTDPLKAARRVVLTAEVTLICAAEARNESTVHYGRDCARIRQRHHIWIQPDGTAQCSFNPHTGDESEPVMYDLMKGGKYVLSEWSRNKKGTA